MKYWQMKSGELYTVRVSSHRSNESPEYTGIFEITYQDHIILRSTTHDGKSVGDKMIYVTNIADVQPAVDASKESSEKALNEP